MTTTLPELPPLVEACDLLPLAGTTNPEHEIGMSILAMRLGLDVELEDGRLDPTGDKLRAAVEMIRTKRAEVIAARAAL